MSDELQEYKTVGIAGGGQLALMMIPPAKKFGFQVFILDPDDGCSSALAADQLIIGDFSSAEAFYKLGEMSDVISFEIEKVSSDLLRKLEKKGKVVRPASNVLRRIQDKLSQKRELTQLGVPVSAFKELNNREELVNRIPCVWKARKAGYDGKGVMILKNDLQVQEVPESPGYTEELVKLDCELAILIARNSEGQVAIYPTAEIIMDPGKNVMDTVVVPAAVPEYLQKECERIARKLVEKFNYVGLMAVEFFVDSKGRLLVNEIYPRPHNSGHYTIEACETSQFEQHIRAITDQALGPVGLASAAATFNILGEPKSCGKPIFIGIETFCDDETVYFHDYCKSTVKPGRKMGHVTVVGEGREAVLEKVRKIQQLVRAEGADERRDS